jgi:ABC-type phosphate/phosphonate transport system permease subunit
MPHSETLSSMVEIYAVAMLALAALVSQKKIPSARHAVLAFARFFPQTLCAGVALAALGSIGAFSAQLGSGAQTAFLGLGLLATAPAILRWLGDTPARAAA